MLNKFGPSGHGEAQVQYLDGDFRVISPGTFVRCAITDTRIPLDELKYWSVDLQEAYATPDRRAAAAFSQRAEAAIVRPRPGGYCCSGPSAPTQVLIALLRASPTTF